MPKKRKFHFIYSNNTDKEEYEIRKEFTIMIRDMIVKNGKTLLLLVYIITFVLITFFIFEENIKQFLSQLYIELNIEYYIGILYNYIEPYKYIITNKYLAIIIILFLLYFITKLNKLGKK